MSTDYIIVAHGIVLVLTLLVVVYLLLCVFNLQARVKHLENLLFRKASALLVALFLTTPAYAEPCFVVSRQEAWVLWNYPADWIKFYAKGRVSRTQSERARSMLFNEWNPTAGGSDEDAARYLAAILVERYACVKTEDHR